MGSIYCDHFLLYPAPHCRCRLLQQWLGPYCPDILNDSQKENLPKLFKRFFAVRRRVSFEVLLAVRLIKCRGCIFTEICLFIILLLFPYDSMYLGPV